jgi:hypothetical protein
MKAWLAALLPFGMSVISAAAQTGPTFYTDPRTSCRVGTFFPEQGLSVSWSGPCVAGVADGSGVVRWTKNGKTYSQTEGTYRAGLRDGRAVTTTAEGVRTEAEYRAGRQNGRCIVTNPKVGRYDGQCVDDKWHGHGTAIFLDGDRYEGEFRNGQENGTGVYIWKNGQRYEGEFTDGERHGRGRVILPGGHVVYVGEYRAGKKEGRGTYVWSDDGTRYDGSWRDDLPDGTGTYRGKGHTYSGQWSAGCFWDGSNRAALMTSMEECRQR